MVRLNLKLDQYLIFIFKSIFHIKSLTKYRTALHWASKKNHLNIIKFLLDKGASKDIKNKDGKAPGELSSDSTVRKLLGTGKFKKIHIIKYDI